MRKPQLKLSHAIFAMIAVGVGTAVWTIGGAFFSGPAPATLSSFTVGEMSAFRTVTGAPGQPRGMILTADRQEITLADKRGKVILVNFWATWCPPCVVEMPALDALQARLGSDRFEVVARARSPGPVFRSQHESGLRRRGARPAAERSV